MHIQSMEPWRVTALFEFLGVHMSILLCHRRKPRDAEIGQKLAVFPAMEGAVCRRHLHVDFEFVTARWQKLNCW